jgi:DNA-binding IclR family transcriptional regulator
LSTTAVERTLHFPGKAAHTQGMCSAEWNSLETDGATPTSVVRRVAALMTAFTERDNCLGINELARRTGLPKATVSRLAKELTAVGLFERKGDKVALGPRIFELGEMASRRRSLRAVALPYLADLREATRQTVHLAVLDGAEVVYVEILRSHGAPRLPSGVGGRLPAHATGVGKALLAAGAPDLRAAVAGAELARVGPRTLTAPGPLLRQLQRIASTGIAYEHEESAPGVACVASVIRGTDAQPVAAVSASGWIGKVDIRRMGPAVRTTAVSIERALRNSGSNNEWRVPRE